MASDRLFSRALKVAMLLWLVGWIIKFRFFVWFLGGICFRYPLDFDFFPAWAANPWVSLCAYLLPLSACAVAIVSKSARVWQSAAVIMTIGSATLCFHQNAYNDATFITSAWSGFWMIWLVSRRNIAVEQRAIYAPLLAQGVISLMFLGGAVGKLTPEYWNGEAFFHIYFLQKNAFIYPWLRENLDVETLRVMAVVFSRAVIIGEITVAALVLFSSRLTLHLSIVIMVCVVIISTWYLFSVMGSLIGIALAGAMLARAEVSTKTTGTLVPDKTMLVERF